MRQELLYNYFYNKAISSNTPVSVMLELLTQCNVNCEHCYIPSHQNRGLSFETVRDLIYQMREMGVVNLSLTGGEIFLRDDLFEIIELARRLHMRVFLLSNATLLSKQKTQRLAQLHISEFSTTLFSMNAEIHDSITQMPGSFAKTLQGIHFLKEAGIRVLVKTPLMQKNAYDYAKVKEYCDENGFTYRVSPLIFERTNGDTSPKKLRVRKTELESIMNDLDTINRNTHIHTEDIPCTALHFSFAIDCNGEVYPCNSLFYRCGNIYEQSLADIWYHSQEMKMIKSIKTTDLTECIECSYSTYCDRCPGMVLMEKKNLFACDGFAKDIAEIRARTRCSGGNC